MSSFATEIGPLIADSEVAHRAIVFADLAGYSSMMNHDELGTLEFIVGCSHLIAEAGARYQGELVQTTGDGYLLLFERAIDAVDFGVELHRLVAKRQTGSSTPAQFRVGINLGQVHRVEGMIHGHAVNVAARLETEALPGTCTVSKAVYDAVRNACDYHFEPAGRPPLKNIAERISLYRIRDTFAGPAGSPEGIARIGLIGPLTVSLEDRDVPFEANKMTSGLLGYLALTGGMREQTEKVAGLLWPSRPHKSAKQAFTQCRRHLAETLKGSEGLFYTANGHIGLNELRFETDLTVILEDLRRGRVPPVLIDTYDWPNRILEGFEAISPVYATWLKVTRTTWRTKVLNALTEIVEKDSPAEETCRDAALAIIALEPGNETAATALIRYHNAHGNRAAALEEYERLESYLGTHHGIAPADRVREAVEAVRRDDIDEMSAPLSERRGAGKPAPQPAKARARLLRIAVAPFSSENETDGHLVDGFRSELLANLARFREWTVVEVDEDVHDAETTREDPVRSHCHYLVNGEYVTVEGQQVLRMTLSDLRSTRVVWRDDIVVDLYAWSSRQREVIGRIAAHLETYISADRLANTIGDSGYDSTSYDDWLRSERIFARWDPEAAVEAEHILERVIERDAEFAPAYSSLASFHNVQHVIRPGMPRDAEDGHKASRLAERSVELDPLDARNHLAVAWTASLNGAFDRAAIHLDLASTLNQNCPTTLVSCAMGYAFIGQIERAEALVGHVLRISPLLSDYQWCYIASVHFLAGRYEDALKAEEQSGDRIVDNPGWTAATLVQLGRQDDARQAFQSLVEAVRPIWAGETEPTAETVLDWFIGAYPLRNDADRQLLSESLKAAIGDDENR